MDVLYLSPKTDFEEYRLRFWETHGFRGRHILFDVLSRNRLWLASLALPRDLSASKLCQHPVKL